MKKFLSKGNNQSLGVSPSRDYALKITKKSAIFCTYPRTPGRTIRADIRLDIRKITDVRVELSVQPRISTVKSAL